MGKPARFREKWRIRWTDEHGVRRSEIHNNYAEANVALAHHIAEVDEIRRGYRQSIIPNKTFNELCDYWMTRRAIKKRSYHDDESIIRVHLRPFFGRMRLFEINVQAVDTFQSERQNLSAKTIHNLLTLLIAMLNCAVEIRWLRNKPKIKKPKIKIVDSDFDYLRTDDEIERFLTAAKGESFYAYCLYATAIYTGLRQGEIAALNWSDVDLESRSITVTKSFDGPTKSGYSRHVPIFDSLLSTLLKWKSMNPSGLVFPNERGNMHAPAARIFKEIFHRVLNAAGFPRIRHNGAPGWYVSFHDLRHSFASKWVRRGGDLYKLQKLLGHQTVSMSQRYAHLQPSVYIADYNRFGEYTEGSDKKVIPLLQLRGASDSRE